MSFDYVLMLLHSDDCSTTDSLLQLFIPTLDGHVTSLPGPYSASQLCRLSDRHLSVKFSANFFRKRGVAWSVRRIPHGRWSQFSRLESLLFFQVAPHLSSRGWVDSVPDPLILRKSGSAGNQIWDPCVCSQELWPLDDRGGPCHINQVKIIMKLLIRLQVSPPIRAGVEPPAGIHDQTLLLSDHCWASHLTRRQVCRVELLLALVSGHYRFHTSRDSRSYFTA
jgi:hypothetical protein